MDSGRIPLTERDHFAWFWLSLSDDLKYLLVHLHPKTLEWLQGRSTRYRGTASREHDAGFYNNQGMVNGSAIFPLDFGRDGDWPKLVVQLPVIRGENEDSPERVKSVHEGLQALFQDLRVPPPDIAFEGHNQALSIALDSRSGLACCGLVAQLSPDFVKRLARLALDVEAIVKVEQVMVDVYCRLWQHRPVAGVADRWTPEERMRSLRKETGVTIYSSGNHCGKLHISVPGESCGLDPSLPSPLLGGEAGYELCPHNVGNEVQKFVLLAGLAKLSSLVREEVVG